MVPRLALKAPGSQLCLGCHKKETLGLTKPHIHATRFCSDCHEAHAANDKALLKTPGVEGCYKCHDRKAFERKVIHPVLTKQGCGACHASHGSEFDKLLVARRGAPLRQVPRSRSGAA